jgi:hypothetical protein
MNVIVSAPCSTPCWSSAGQVFTVSMEKEKLEFLISFTIIFSEDNTSLLSFLVWSHFPRREAISPLFRGRFEYASRGSIEHWIIIHE